MKLKVKMIMLPLLMLSAAFVFRFAGAEANIATPVYAASSEAQKAELNIYDMKVPAPKSTAAPASVSKASEMRSRDLPAGAAPPAATLSVPNIDTDFKAYMDYRTITDRKAPQWRFRELAYTDEYGFRRIVDDYVVALGTYYASGVGERFRITLDTGVSFTAITGDIKDNKHTDPYNMYTPLYHNGKSIGGCVVEFLVDTNKLDKNAKLLGTASYFDAFEGNIAKIERL
jgi:hypothetical protein